MKKIVFATTNEGKMNEVREILKDLDYEILSLRDINLNTYIDENGSTFEENAIIKARAVMELTGEIVLADDSGLEVDYINKEPGIHSARFLGEDTAYEIKNNYIIERLGNAKGDERSARFVCVIACVFPDGRTFTRQGIIEGYIADKISGEQGFGYDPIFIVPEFQCTTADMSPEQKNEISHRGKALRKIKSVLMKNK